VITALIMRIGFAVLNAVFGVLPNWTPVPAQDTGIFGTVGGYVSWGNGYFPMVDLGLALLALVAAKLWFSAFSLTQWVYKLIPFKAT
jgi:hypothetical protein